MNKEKSIRNSFREGPIASEFIAEAIKKHQVKTHIGAHDIFLGQVRADHIDGKIVEGIEYSSYTEMANLKFHEIKEETFKKYDLSCMHIYHSIGLVPVGEICLFVFVSAPHRKVCFEAIEFIVEEIKSKVPIFGKELFEKEGFKWKENQ